MRLHPYIALPAATLVALASLAIVGPAHANIKDTKGRYVFGGNTYSKANFDKFSDPVTLIMRGGGGRITTDVSADESARLDPQIGGTYAVWWSPDDVHYLSSEPAPA